MRLLDYLPEKYERSPATAAIQNAVQPEADALWAARNWLLAQLDPHTADGEGLKLWEDAMGVSPSAGDDLEQRRGRIIAKIRGMGAVDAALLQSIVESFGVSGVTVAEHPRESRVDIRYSVQDTRPLLDTNEIADAILEIFPAHLELLLIPEIHSPPFGEIPGHLFFRRFTVAVAFSNRRSFPHLRLDGSWPLDGSALLNTVPSSMFGFPHLRVSGGMAKNKQSVSRAALTVDTMYTLDGSVLLDGSRKLNADIRQEVL